MRTWQQRFANSCSAALLIGAGACGWMLADAPPSEPTLSATGAWARAADSGATTAVYFVLNNTDSIADTVRMVTSADAEETGLHISTQHSGMMHMTAISTLPVPARDSVSFRPLGAHVMLTRLRRPLAAGDSVLIRVDFVSGDSLDIQAHVRQP